MVEVQRIITCEVTSAKHEAVLRKERHALLSGDLASSNQVRAVLFGLFCFDLCVTVIMIIIIIWWFATTTIDISCSVAFPRFPRKLFWFIYLGSLLGFSVVCWVLWHFFVCAEPVR